MPDAPAATTAEHNRAVAELNGLPKDRAALAEANEGYEARFGQ